MTASDRAGMLLYLDASALVKLVRREAETEPLMREIARWERHVTSVVAEVEVGRALRRAGLSSEAAAGVFDGLTLLELDESVRRQAGTVGDPSLRALDAIHLASALSLGDALGAIACYDARLGAAAAAAGLPVVAPA